MEVLKSHFCFKSQEDVTALMKAVVYDQVHPTPRYWPLLDLPAIGLDLLLAMFWPLSLLDLFLLDDSQAWAHSFS